jgi:hypothetical protein
VKTSQRNLRRLLLKRIMKCWISVSPALALRVREPTAASYVPMPLSCNNWATMRSCAQV